MEDVKDSGGIKSGFRSTENKGFQITFQNGWTISVQFGKGNYCEVGYIGEYGGEMKKLRHYSKDAEIAIFKGEEWYNFGTDTVSGYCEPKEVAEWISKVSNW